MKQVVYTSEKVESFKSDEILEMLDAAQKSNNEHGIHGLLIYRKNHFLQVFEGPDDSVDTLRDKVCADPRHDNINVLFNDHIDKLEFDLWDMAYCPEIKYKEIIGSIEKDLGDLNLDECNKLLKQFSEHLVRVNDI